jgi:hypothetical protein
MKDKMNLLKNVKNNTKSLILALGILAAFLVSEQGYSQSSIEITTSYGYQFGAKHSYGVNYIKIDDSDQYGITLGFETYDDLMAEISYVHQGSELRIRDVFFGPKEVRLADLSADWIMVGATKYFPNGKIRPFAGGALGLAIFTPKNENNILNRSLDNSTKFAFSFKAGVNIMFSDRVGLNLQGNLMFPVEWGGVYVGGGPGGVSAGVGASSTILIGGFSGGLVFKLN